MKERPILFKGELVRAILDDRKTQTRRLVKGQALEWLKPDGFTPEFVASPENHMCPYGDPGDRLWVREGGWYHVEHYDDEDDGSLESGRDAAEFFRWKESPRRGVRRWRDGTIEAITFLDESTPLDCAPRGDARPSIHMPRWASRIDLEIVEVRAQRLQNITEQDAREEGFDEWIPCNLITGLKGVRIGGGHRQATCREHFAVAWDAINGKRAPWASNPWVWAITFKRVRP